jgi:hypothetical protein
MSDIVAELRDPYRPQGELRPLCLEAAEQIGRLRTALDVLLHETMYKDHPEASEMAIAALKQSGIDVRERG